MKTSLWLILIAACGTSESSGLLTKGISAGISVTTEGDGITHVGAELFEGNPDQLIFVDLEPGDELVADSDTDSVTLVQSQLLNIIAYDGDLDGGDEGDEITIDFQRSVDDGAPASTATLPAAFTLDPIAATVSRAADLTITYGPADSDDDMRWEAKGDCIQTATGSIPVDTGTITIAAASLLASPQTASCAVTLTVTRERGGILDAHFKGGTIVGQQARAAVFTSAP